jgi:sugar phosphate isomerase/epimerase
VPWVVDLEGKERSAIMLFGAMNFPIRPLLDEVESIASLGFDYLELAMDPPGAHHTVVREKKDDLLQALEEKKMGIVCHLPSFLSTADLTEGIRRASVQEELASLESAAELNPLKVVVHPGYALGLGRYLLEKTMEYALESLIEVVEKAETLGLTLCLENMFPRTSIMVRPDDFAEVFERIPSLKMTLDTGHANIGAKGRNRSLEFIGRFPDRIGHVHVSDNFGKEDNHIPIGTGTVDYPRIVKALKSTGYDDTVTLEIFSPDRDYLKRSREKFARFFDRA